MIEILGAQPADDEIAAIVAALSSLTERADASAASQSSAWTLASRFPDLDIDDLRALIASR